VAWRGVVAVLDTTQGGRRGDGWVGRTAWLANRLSRPKKD
jgi:hypothetical protein